MFYSQPVYEWHSPVQPQLTEIRLVQIPVSYIPMQQGQKRILSPESVENAQEKRTRHISFDLSSSQPSASAGGPEVTLADLMTDILFLRVNVATKKDLQVFAEVNDPEDGLTAQAEEISQIRSTTQTQEARLKQVEESLSRRRTNPFTGSTRAKHKQIWRTPQ